MVSGHEHFSIPSQDVDEVEKILTEESKKRNKSSFIVNAIKEKHERENFRILDDFQTPQTELDNAPRVNEPITKEYLKTLSAKDIGHIRKMVYYNKEVLDEFVDSQERTRQFMKEVTRSI